MKNKYLYYYLAVLIICFGTGLRLIGLDKGIWLDEYSSIETATQDSGVVPSLRKYDHPPTYYLLLRAWAKLNTSEVFLRIPSVIFGVMTIVLVILWMKSYSYTAGLVSGLICAAMPILIRYSQEIRDYPLLLFSVAFSFYCAHGISNNSDLRWYAALAVGLSVTVTSHLAGIMMLPCICVYLLPTLVKYRSVAQWSRFVLSVSIPCVVFIYVYYFFMGGTNKSGGWWMPPLSVDLIMSTFKYVFGMDALTHAADVISRHNSIAASLYSYSAKAALIVSVGCLALLGNWRRSWPLLAAATVYWIEIVIYSVLIVPIFWYRIVMPGLIPLIGFAGLQAATIKGKNIRFAAIAGISVISMLLAAGWIVTEARVPKEAYQQVAQLLKSEYQSDNLVVFYPEYIEGVTRYYCADLPEENIVSIESSANIEDIKPVLTKHINQSGANTTVLFLVVRSDNNMKKNTLFFHELLTYLESSAVQTYPPHNFGILSVRKYELRPHKSAIEK
jgi:uncharacterized membrane protein